MATYPDEIRQIPDQPHPVPPFADEIDVAPPAKASPDTMTLLSLLLVGAALEGTEQFMSRLRVWHASLRPDPLVIADERISDVLRYAFIGMLFEGEDRARHGLRALRRVSEGATRLLTAALSPFVGSLAQTMRYQPTREQASALADRWQDDIGRWIQVGRRAEQTGRLLARRSLDGALVDVLSYVLQSGAVRTYLEQQGIDVAGTAVDEARGRVASADDWIERIARGVLRRPPGAPAAAPGRSHSSQATPSSGA